MGQKSTVSKQQLFNFVTFQMEHPVVYSDCDRQTFVCFVTVFYNSRVPFFPRLSKTIPSSKSVGGVTKVSYVIDFTKKTGPHFFFVLNVQKTTIIGND